MNVVGIVAEYNPFHNGHAYHISEAISRSKADHCIICMSGNFVQRGEIACADKYTRAAWALSSGADIVIELPTAFVLSPAPVFSSSAVRLLIDTGVITHLSFGTESDGLEPLKRIAEIELNEPQFLKAAIASELAKGKSYPRAFYEAFSIQYGKVFADTVRTPNNILAIEYLKTIKNCAPQIVPVPVFRKGCSYDDEELSGSFSSALSIRNSLSEGITDCFRSVPACVTDYFLENPYLPSNDSLSSMTYYALRKLDKERLACLPEVTEGLENRIYDAVRQQTSLNDVLDKVKSKRYTHAKLKRTFLHALLDIDNELMVKPEYIKILGFKQSARPLLSEISKRTPLPLIVRSRDSVQLNPVGKRCLLIDELGSDLYAYVSGHSIRKDHSGAIIV